MNDTRVIIGPCPACHMWQLEYDQEKTNPEHVEEALLEHDREDHPGVLVTMARLQQGVPLVPRLSVPREGWT